MLFLRERILVQLLILLP